MHHLSRRCFTTRWLEICSSVVAEGIREEAHLQASLSTKGIGWSAVLQLTGTSEHLFMEHR